MSPGRRSAHGRTRSAVVVAQQTATEHPAEPGHDLQFDFDGRRAAQGGEPVALPRKKDDSIKQAIIRWLNEQL